MSINGDSSPIWNDEIGWSTAPGVAGNGNIAEEQAAKWVTLICTQLQGIDRMAWYYFDLACTEKEG